jgi:RHS repeat-associated protein
VKSYLWGLDLSGSLQGAGGVGGLVAVKLSSGTAHFAAYDGNGNVAGLVDGSSGAASALYEYGPFGETIRVTDTLSGTNPFHYSSKYTDIETDLVYYGYRYYNPSTGRWPNRDPIEEKGGRNLYGFLANNPISQVDPLGLKIKFIGCSDVQQEQILKEFKETCHKATRPDKNGLRCLTRCAEPKFEKKVMGYCNESIDFIVHCADATEPNCKGSVCGFAYAGVLDSIWLCPRAFSEDRSKCNGASIGCLTFHEALHAAGFKGHESINQIEKCLGCPSTSGNE